MLSRPIRKNSQDSFYSLSEPDTDDDEDVVEDWLADFDENVRVRECLVIF